MQDLLVQGSNPNGPPPPGDPREIGLPRAAQVTRRRILVVDDEVDTAQSWTYLLGLSGHLVEYAVNGYAALRLAKVFLPHVLILDLKLPDFHGADLVWKMRTDPDLKSIYVISVTGSTDEVDRVRAIAAGCDELLTKPIGVKVLEQLIARAPIG